jgi:hypothetical protein
MSIGTCVCVWIGAAPQVMKEYGSIDLNQFIKLTVAADAPPDDDATYSGGGRRRSKAAGGLVTASGATGAKGK